jgi:hypothetical protein
MKEQRVAQILEGIAEDEVPATLDLWPDIQARVQPRRRPLPWTRLRPTTRLGWAFLALALSLAFGAVTYAVAPVVGRLFQQESGLRHVEQADLVQELDLSQTVDGVTVTLERVYADANRIVVGFTIKSPNGQRYEARHLTLTDAAGTVFPGTLGYGVTGQSDILDVSLPPGEGAYVLAFDAAAVEGAPEELALRLVMDVEELVLPPDAPGPSPTLAGTPAEPPEPMVVELEPMPVGAIVGPLTFDFSVPFIPGRTVEVQQTVEAVGIAVMLERIVVTPSETRAFLCFEPPDGDSKEWTPIVTLDAGDGQDLSGISRQFSGTCYVLSGTLQFKADGSVTTVNETGEEDCYCYGYGFLAPLYDQRGEWTLTVTELVGFDLAPPYEQTRLAGPWVFRFHVP